MAVLAEVLRKQDTNGVLFTGEPAIDEALGSLYRVPPVLLTPDSANATNSQAPLRGIPARTFTELSGLPGSGKTAVWLALVLETLRRGTAVLYVGCNFSTFPLTRARRLSGWNSARYEERIEQLAIDSFEQLLVLDHFVDMSRYGLVLLDRYDALIKTAWSRPVRERAAAALTEKADSFCKFTSVVATSGCVKYHNEENLPLFAPATYTAKSASMNMLRLMVYKDTLGNSVLSTGTKFKVQLEGIRALASDEHSVSTPLHMLSKRQRTTPHRVFKTLPLTPLLSGHKRRMSVSTPSRRNKLHGSPLDSSSDCQAGCQQPNDRIPNHCTSDENSAPASSDPLSLTPLPVGQMVTAAPTHLHLPPPSNTTESLSQARSLTVQASSPAVATNARPNHAASPTSNRTSHSSSKSGVNDVCTLTHSGLDLSQDTAEAPLPGGASVSSTRDSSLSETVRTAVVPSSQPELGDPEYELCSTRPWTFRDSQ